MDKHAGTILSVTLAIGAGLLVSSLAHHLFTLAVTMLP